MSQYAKEVPRRTYTSSWTEFEKRLIDFVREHPIIYDVKPDDVFIQVKTCNKLWKDFANKWNYSAATCKRRWRVIRSAYLKLEERPINTFVSLSSHKRLTDGRLSFLDHLRSTKLNTQTNDIENSDGNSESNEAQSYSDSNIIEMVLSDDEDTLQMTNTNHSKKEQPLSKILESTIDLLFKDTPKPTDDTALKPLKTYSRTSKSSRASRNLKCDEVIMLSDEDDPMETTSNDNLRYEEQPLRQKLDETVSSCPDVSDLQSINEENINIELNNQDDIMLTDEQDPLEITNDYINADQPLCHKLETTVSDSPKVIVTEIKILKPADKQPIHEIQMNTDSDTNQEIIFLSDYETKKNDHTASSDIQSQTLTVTDRINEVMKVIKNNNIKFSYFETSLIKYAKKHPLLYETRDLQDDPSRRKRVKFLWDTFAAAFYPSIEAKRMSGHCQKIWNRIRLEHFIVHKLVDENKDIRLRPPLSKYMGRQLSFLKEMYDYIKRNSLRIHYKGTGSLEDNGYLEACSESIPFDWVVINFVKKHPIIYDKRIEKRFSSSLTRLRNSIRMLWDELAINLNTSRMDCEEIWNEILIDYLKYLRNKTRKPNMKIPCRFNNLSFLNKAYEIDVEYDDDTEGPSASSLTNNPRDMEISGKKKRNVNKKNILTCEIPILEELTEDEVRSEILGIYSNETIAKESDRKVVAGVIDTFEELIEEQQKVEARSENLPAHKNETQSSTIIDQSKTKQIPVASDNKNNKITEEIKSDSIVDLSLENVNFFRDIGKYITDYFPEKKQKEIQIKSWALVTQLELEMLEEDQ